MFSRSKRARNSNDIHEEEKEEEEEAPNDAKFLKRFDFLNKTYYEEIKQMPLSPAPPAPNTEKQQQSSISKFLFVRHTGAQDEEDEDDEEDDDGFDEGDSEEDEEEGDEDSGELEAMDVDAADDGNDSEELEKAAPVASAENVPLPFEHKIRRPEIDFDKDDIRTFMVNDVTQGSVVGSDGYATPEILLWGTTREKHSVCARIPWFRPYFYAHITNEAKMEDVRRKLEIHLRAKYGNSPLRKAKQYVLSCEQVEGRSIMGYVHNAPMDIMYKITMALPAHIKEARDSLDFANKAITEHKITTYEANVPFELRFLVDHNLAGGQWVRVANGLVAKPQGHSTSRCQLNYVIDKPDAFCAIPIKDRSDICPIRSLSYDIEVLSDGIQFPDARKGHQVICICAVLQEEQGLTHRVCFTTAQKARIEHIKNCDDLVICKDEREMLLKFTRYMVISDPDLLTGWNTNGFDMPYMSDRAEELGIEKEFLSFSRIATKRVRVIKKIFQSKAYGAKQCNDIQCDGRFMYDGLDFMLRGVMQKYRSYTLNYISQCVLQNEQKDDVSYFQIPRMYQGSILQQSKLISYCLKDAMLPLKILDKMKALVNGVEQARVTGVPFKWLMQRGQGMKTFSNLLRYKQPFEHVPTVSNKHETQEYTAGGYVRDPLRGFKKLQELLISLDFASLYPSIMQAYNICYSTIMPRKLAEMLLQPGDYYDPPPAMDALTEAEVRAFWASNPTPKQIEKFKREQAFRGKQTDYVFVKPHIRKGILPAMLETLVATRRAAVKEKDSVDPLKDPLLHSVLDGRQSALKVVCNSVYGFVKAYICRKKELMEAVCAFGRNMIKNVANIIVTEFDGRDNNTVDVAACKAAGVDLTKPDSETNRYIRFATSPCWVVDIEACEKLGIDPEDESLGDKRPKRLAKATIVYGDTDSVMVSMGRITIPDCLRLGKLMAARCTAAMLFPNKLEFENIKLISLYLNKKRYAALEILEKDIKPGWKFADCIKFVKKVSLKGLEGKRRDNALIASETQMKVIEILLREQNVNKAYDYVKQVLTDLLTGRVDMSKLIISKGLSKTEEGYKKGGTKQQHVELAKRIAKRAHETGETPYQTGDRVPYVMIASAKDSKAYERAEDPVYAQKHNLPVDVNFYIEKQVCAAVFRVMTCVEEPERCVEIKSSMPKRKREGFIAYQKLFLDTLPHMQKRLKRVGEQSGVLGNAIETSNRCIECGVPCGSDDYCCNSCDRWLANETMKIHYGKAKRARDQAWQQCVACMAVEHEDETKSCTNKTCNNLYKRFQCTRDLEDLGKKLSKKIKINP